MAKSARTPTPHEVYAARARARHHRLMPFRLGLEVGRAGDFLPSPYAPRSRGERLYYEGVRAGGDQLAREIERQREEDAKK